MKMDRYYLVFVRPVGSGCWTVERIARHKKTAEEYAEEERARVIKFADGSEHKQSTAIVRVWLPGEKDEEQTAHAPDYGVGCQEDRR